MSKPHCQRAIEGDTLCINQCDHCIEYFRPLEAEIPEDIRKWMDDRWLETSGGSFRIEGAIAMYRYMQEELKKEWCKGFETATLKMKTALSSIKTERDELKEVLELLNDAISYATECSSNYVIETIDKKIIASVLNKYPKTQD